MVIHVKIQQNDLNVIRWSRNVLVHIFLIKFAKIAENNFKFR